MITVENLSFTYPAPQARPRDRISALKTAKSSASSAPPAREVDYAKILIRLLLGYEGQAELGAKSGIGTRASTSGSGSFELPNHYARLTALENLRHFAAFYQGPTIDPTGYSIGSVSATLPTSVQARCPRA